MSHPIPPRIDRSSPWARLRTRRALLGGLLATGVGAAFMAGAVLAEDDTVSACDPEVAMPGLRGDGSWAGVTFGLGVSWELERWRVGTRRDPSVVNAMGREDRPVECADARGPAIG